VGSGEAGIFGKQFLKLHLYPINRTNYVTLRY